MSDRLSKIIRELEELDLKGVEFHDARKQLLEKGYTENEINHAVYSAPHDGRANRPVPEAEHTKIFRRHPEATKRLADNMLKSQNAEMRSNKRRFFITNLLASRFAPGPHAHSHYGYKAAESLEFPYFTFIFLSVNWFIVSTFYLDLSSTVIRAGIIILAILLYIKGRYF